MTPEGKVKAAVKKVLNSYSNVWYFMPVLTGYGVAGIPDFICSVGGKFLAIECKAEGGRLTAMQVKTIDDINRIGGRAYVIGPDEVTDLKALVNMVGGIKK